MKRVKQKLTLHEPATYQIKVPGHLKDSWSSWAGAMTVTTEGGDDDPPVTILTGVVADQAALQSLLRRLYSLGLPLISVNWVEDMKGGSEITCFTTELDDLREKFVKQRLCWSPSVEKLDYLYDENFHKMC